MCLLQPYKYWCFPGAVASRKWQAFRSFSCDLAIVGFRACGIELGTTVWGVVFIAWAPPCVDRLPTARRAEAAGVPDHSRGTASRSGAPQGLTLHPEPKL